MQEKLKRQHSAEPVSESNSSHKTPHLKVEDSPGGGTSPSGNSTTANAGTPPDGLSPLINDVTADGISSPFKRARSSMPGLASSAFGGFGSSVNEQQALDAAGDRAASTPEIKLDATPKLPQVMDEEEL